VEVDAPRSAGAAPDRFARATIAAVVGIALLGAIVGVWMLTLMLH
jgi:hypothetical protein